MTINLEHIVDALAVMGAVGSVRWVLKLRKDLNAAFMKIRKIEDKLGEK